MTRGVWELAALGHAVDAAAEVGLLDSLLERSATAEEHAAQLRLDPAAMRRVLDLLAAAGLAERDGDAWRASAALREESDMQPGGVTFAAFGFRGIAEHLRTGKPPHRWSDGPIEERAQVYRDVVAKLGAMFREPATQLADALGGAPRHVLELGAGSGVFGLAVLRRHPEARLTAVDLPAVAEVCRERAAAEGLSDRTTVIGGDFFEVDLPAECDRVLVCNVLRILEPARAAALVARAAGALRAGGELVIVDVLDDDEGDVALIRAVYRLHLALRSGAGGPHARAEIERWLADAGLEPPRAIRLTTSRMRETALVAVRPG